MPDFKDYSYHSTELGKAQDADHDMREQVREQDLFLHKKDGMWEPDWWNFHAGQPRYTFDMTSPAVKKVSGAIKKADFDIRVVPASGPATKEVAQTLDGLVRNIENISDASTVFSGAAKHMVSSGLAGWRVVTRFVDDDSFDQDLMIEPIHNFAQRVWFQVGAERQDRADSRACWVLQGIPTEEYREKWPEGSGLSVSDGRSSQAYFDVAETVIVGEALYIETVKREIVLMDNGRVYEVDEDFESVKDELERLGIAEIGRREREKKVVYSHKFDGGGWLEDRKKTVFSWLPVIPIFGNYSIFENKSIYYGMVLKMMDPQRVFNYAKSRETGEGALAPRAKYWMTEAQAAGHEAELETMNTNNDAVQFFNPDPENPGIPQQSGGAQVNQGLMATSQSMQDIMIRAAGFSDPSMGEQINNQSGEAIKTLIDQGNIGNVEDFESLEIGICHTAKIIVDAIPVVYERPGRQVRILGEGGEASMDVLNQEIFDQDQGNVVVLNDLSAGKYTATCKSGKSRSSQMEETVDAFIKLAPFDPSIIQMAGDVLFSNLSAPGMDVIAERKRQQILEAGLIPFDQMTEDEKAQLQQRLEAQQQQGQQPDPAQIIAMAEAEKAQADTQKVLVDAQAKAADIEIAQRQEDREDIKLRADIQEADDKSELAEIKALMEQNKAILDGMKTQAETLKVLREAMGVDGIVGPHNTEAYIRQAGEITETQDQAGFPSEGELRLDR